MVRTRTRTWTCVKTDKHRICLPKYGFKKDRIKKRVRRWREEKKETWNEGDKGAKETWDLGFFEKVYYTSRDKAGLGVFVLSCLSLGSLSCLSRRQEKRRQDKIKLCLCLFVLSCPVLSCLFFCDCLVLLFCESLSLIRVLHTFGNIGKVPGNTWEWHFTLEWCKCPLPSDPNGHNMFLKGVYDNGLIWFLLPVSGLLGPPCGIILSCGCLALSCVVLS